MVRPAMRSIVRRRTASPRSSPRGSAFVPHKRPHAEEARSAVSKDGPRRDCRHDFLFSRHEMSELLEVHRPRNHKRAQGMPDARCTRGRLCSKKHRRQQLQVHRNSRHSLRNGFNGFLRALLGDHSLVATVISGIVSTNLAPASERQDHTTSPSAQTPLVAQVNRARRCASIASHSQRP